MRTCDEALKSSIRTVPDAGYGRFVPPRKLSCKLDVVMKLMFGRAKHGWLPAELEADDVLLQFDISYLPNDFLLELTEALRFVLHQPGERFAILSQEPVETEWRFYRIQDAVVFSLVEFPDSSRLKGTGKKLLERTGYPLEIVLPLWRGLRELAGRKFKEGFSTHWTHHWAHPFPSESLDALSEAVSIARTEAEAP